MSLFKRTETQKLISRSIVIDAGSNTEFSGEVILSEAKQCASQLTTHGVKEGHRIAVLADNNHLWLTLFFAIRQTNATMITLDTSHTDEEINEKLTITKPHYIISIRNFTDICQQSLSLEYNHQDVYLIYKADYQSALSDADCAMMVFSSGSSGKPKLIMLSHQCIDEIVTFYHEELRSIQSTTTLSLLPLSAIYPASICLAYFVAGKKIVFANPYKDKMVEVMKRYPIDVLPAVPLIVEKIHSGIFEKINRENIGKRAMVKIMMSLCGAIRRLTGKNMGRTVFKSIHQQIAPNLNLILSGGATLSKSALVDMYQLGFTIYEGYGLTETAGIVSMRKDVYSQFGTAGQPIDGTTILIDQETHEISIQTKRMMMGYFEEMGHHDLNETSKPFKTGDIGFYDNKNNLHINGRMKDIIVLSDETKYMPSDLEKYYKHIDGIREFAVFSMVDENHSGDIIKMAAVLDKDYTQQEVKIEIENIEKKIPPKFHIDEIVFKDVLPRNSLGKICREKLKE